MDSISIHTLYASPEELPLDPAEVARRLRDAPGAEAAIAALSALLPRAGRAPAYRACFARVPVAVEGACVTLPGGRVESEQLARHLAGCREAFLLAVTAGFGLDRFAQRHAEDPAEAAACRAIGAAALDLWADAVCGALRESVGLPLSSRCCPGQGDFPAAWRKVLLRTLGTEERIGLSAEGGFRPTWSLAAVVGIQSTFSASTFPAGCTPASCATCRKDCALRPAPEG